MRNSKTIQNYIRAHDRERQEKVVAEVQEMKGHKAAITEKTFIPFHNVTGDVRSFQHFCRCMRYTARPRISGYGRQHLDFLGYQKKHRGFLQPDPF